MAQDPPSPPDARGFYASALEADQTVITVGVDQTAFVPLRFSDLSKDSSRALADTDGAYVSSHQTQYFIEYPEGANIRGWNLVPPVLHYSRGGEVLEPMLLVGVDRFVETPVLDFTVVAKTSFPGGPKEARLRMAGITPGLSTFNVQVSGAVDLAPDQPVNIPVTIFNGGLLPRGFSLEITQNDCGLLAAPASNILVPAKASSTYMLTVKGPDDRFWFNSLMCTMTLQVWPHDSPSQTRTVQVSPQVSGFFVNPDWVVTGTFIALFAVLLLIILARRKAHIEEAILGKPQKPWTIPVEQVYLRHLKEQDERAWYVVRHHLMVEEYRSAMDWYYAYKKATKGERTQERVVLQLEDKYERRELRWQRRLDAPMVEVERFADKLQAKLDRKDRRKLAKAQRKHTAQVGKLEEAYAKTQARQAKRHRVAVARARKRGEAEPAEPEVAPFEAPPEPELVATELASHRWQRRVDRATARAERKVARIERKHERDEGRFLAKARRKVGKVAKRLQDEEFIRQHPLLFTDGQ